MKNGKFGSRDLFLKPADLDALSTIGITFSLTEVLSLFLLKNPAHFADSNDNVSFTLKDVLAILEYYDSKNKTSDVIADILTSHCEQSFQEKNMFQFSRDFRRLCTIIVSSPDSSISLSSKKLTTVEKKIHLWFLQIPNLPLESWPYAICYHSHLADAITFYLQPKFDSLLTISL